MIGSDVAGPTAIDKDLAETLVGTLVLPSWARSILAVRPIVQHVTPTDDEPVMAKMILRSDDFSVQPFEVLCAPTGSIIGTGSSQAPEPPWYPINCPINGGDRLKVYGEVLAATTAHPWMISQVIVSDKKAGAQLKGRVGTLTTSGAADIYTAGTAYTITGGTALKELIGFAACVAAATVEGVMGVLEFRSNDFKDPSPLKMPTPSMAGSITNGGVMSVGLSRAKVDLPILSPCMIQDGCTLADIPTAGKFITGVLYT